MACQTREDFANVFTKTKNNAPRPTLSLEDEKNFGHFIFSCYEGTAKHF
jgi:hypothetical protein